MMDYIEIDTTPGGERCTQAGDADALKFMRIEADAFINQMKRVLGPNPEGTQFKIQRNKYEPDDYLDIRFSYDEDRNEHLEYAQRLTDFEEHCNSWDAVALQELKAKGYRFPEEPEEEFEEDEGYTIDNGPTGHGSICMSDADPGL